MGPWFGVEVALAAALEHIPAAAFVISATGKVLNANGIGTTWLAACSNRGVLTGRGGPDRARFAVTAFAFGATTHYLAVLRPAETPPALSLVGRWKLTPRESDVVGAILKGATNVQIASDLGCAIKTVEHHVSSILRKANVENRASLIVALLEK